MYSSLHKLAGNVNKHTEQLSVWVYAFSPKNTPVSWTYASQQNIKYKKSSSIKLQPL